MASIIGVQELQHTNGTSAATIDSTGRILTPARPAFLVQWSASQTGLSATGYNRLNFDTALFDVGSNLSGAVFTAPVSGIYQFNLSQRFDSIGSGYVIIGLADDGSTHNAASSLWNTSYRISGSPATNFETLQSSITYELTAGDDVAPWYYNSADGAYSLSITGAQFSGFLVG